MAGEGRSAGPAVAALRGCEWRLDWRGERHPRVAAPSAFDYSDAGDAGGLARRIALDYSGRVGAGPARQLSMVWTGANRGAVADRSHCAGSGRRLRLDALQPGRRASDLRGRLLRR